MRAAAAMLAGVLVAAQPVCAAAQPAQVEAGPWKHFAIWFDAIAQHTPGAKDAALESMLGLSAAELESAFPNMVTMLRGVITRSDRKASFDTLFSRYGTRAQAPANPQDLQMRFATLLSPGALDRFLKRAALLHTDLAIIHPLAHTSAAAGTSHIVGDGRAYGAEGRPWHWMLARAFLHLLPKAAEDADVRLWYQAVGTHLWSTMRFTEAMPHLRSALQIFPGDAEIQFLLGVTHEAQAAPHIQAGVEDQLVVMPAFQRSRYVSGVLAADLENRDARAAFQKAVNADPGHVEARIRLGRGLLLHGDAERAVSELRTALERADERAVRYLAQLFLGRASEQLGRTEEARAAYEAAAALYPLAQSPRLAISQLDFQEGGRDGARSLIALLSDPAARDGYDPWWDYHSERAEHRSIWITRLRQAFAKAIVR